MVQHNITARCRQVEIYMQDKSIFIKSSDQLDMSDVHKYMHYRIKMLRPASNLQHSDKASQEIEYI